MNKSQTHGRLQTAALPTAIACDREAEDTEGSEAGGKGNSCLEVGEWME